MALNMKLPPLERVRQPAVKIHNVWPRLAAKPQLTIADQKKKGDVTGGWGRCVEKQHKPVQVEDDMAKRK